MLSSFASDATFPSSSRDMAMALMVKEKHLEDATIEGVSICLITFGQDPMTSACIAWHIVGM